MGSWKRSLAVKLAWVLLAGVIFYFLGMGLNMMPQAVVDSLSWFGDNFNQIVILICFLVGCYVILKLKKKEGYSQG